VSLRLGIYMHVPFCQRKCSYCSFISYAQRLDLAASYGYARAVLAELKARAYPFDGLYDGWTLYIGGGTPTVLDKAALAELVSGAIVAMKAKGWTDPIEASVEANPGTFSHKGAVDLVKAGITRFSIGVQSLIDSELKAIGRIHSSEDAERAVQAARASGARSVSVDLMTGLPGQSLSSLSATLEGLAALKPDHVSCYALTLEEGTPLKKAVDIGETLIPDDDVSADMMELASGALEAMGLMRYEISNYARPGHESLHNLGYWSDMPYLGLGAAAHSYSPAELVRSWNVSDPVEYVGRIDLGNEAELGREKLTARTSLNDHLILSLRTKGGACLQDLESRHGLALEPRQLDALAWAKAHGLLSLDGEGRVRLTRKGFMLSNSLFSKLV